MRLLAALACVLVALPVSATLAKHEDHQGMAAIPTVTPPVKRIHSKKQIPDSVFLKSIRSGICPGAKGMEILRTAGEKRRGKC